MSAHNHDEEIIKRLNKESEVVKALREKANKKLDETIVNAILHTDIKGLSKKEALKKLENAIDDAIDSMID